MEVARRLKEQQEAQRVQALEESVMARQQSSAKHKQHAFEEAVRNAHNSHSACDLLPGCLTCFW
jgi:hypothetical protein